MDTEKKVWLDPQRLMDRVLLGAYMNELFRIPEEEARNLDQLHDELSEVRENVMILVSRTALLMICKNDFAYRVLCVMNDAANENPYLTLSLSGAGARNPFAPD